MAISLIDNLKIQNKKQNVERDSFATIADMVAYSPNYLPNIFHAMCEETGKMYIYDVNNDEDPDLGRWRVLQGEGGGTADVPIEKIKVNGVEQTPVDKVVDIAVPDNSSYNAKVDTLETKIDELNKTIYLREVNDYSSFVFGHIHPDGTVASGNKYICFKDKIKITTGSTISVDSGYKYQYALYDFNSGDFISRQTWKTDETVISGNYRIKIEIADLSESILSDFLIAEHLHTTLYTINSSVSEVIKEVVKVIDNTPINFVDGKNITTNYDVGEIIDLTPEVVSSYSYAIQEVSENDMVLINGMGGTRPRIWCFIDNDNKVVQVADNSTSQQNQKNLVLNVPIGATKIIINSQTFYLGDCYLLGLSSKVDNLQAIAKKNVERISEITLDMNYISGEEANLLRQSNNIVDTLGIDTFKNKLLEIAQPTTYKSWSFIGRVDNKLLCLFAVGTSHEDPCSNIYYKTSENGVIWSNERKIISYDNQRDNITGKGFDNDENFIFWVRRGYPNGVNTKFELYRTTDGNTFEQISSNLFDTAHGHIGDIVNVPNHGLFAFWNSYGDTRAWGYVKSVDNGVTWTETIVESNQAVNECPVEMSPVYLGNGKILVMGRQDSYGATFQIQSSDYGQTFEKFRTNTTVAQATPSVLYDSNSDMLSIYFFDRSTGQLKLITATSSAVWNSPTSWESSTLVMQVDGRGQDAGNVNACWFNNEQFVSFYSGNETNTGIYVVIK